MICFLLYLIAFVGWCMEFF